MKFLVLAILITTSQATWAQRTVTVKGSGTGYGVCWKSNPRCSFDFTTRRECKDNAKDEAKENAEYNCHRKGGTITDEAYVTKSDSKKTTGWLDTYDCYAVAEVKCAL